MIILRSVTSHDRNALLNLAEKMSVGITSLPKNQQALEQRIELSMQSFEKNVTAPGGELYFFVMEDQESGDLVGCSAIKACVGKKTPFYSYKLSKLTNFSKSLGCQLETGLLTLVNDYHGVAELMTLYLKQDMRHLGLGQFLSLSRFLFIAEYQKRFPETLIAELRGVSDEKGHSPFWSHVGKHFFNMDFEKADYLTGMGNKQFIADLIPRYPIYTCLLPKVAQKVVGVAHQSSQAAQKLLQREGFHYEDYVDIFDAGPTVQARMTQVKSIQNSRICKIAKISDSAKEGKKSIIASIEQTYKACIGVIDKLDDETCCIHTSVAKALQLSVGEKIRYYGI